MSKTFDDDRGEGYQAGEELLPCPFCGKAAILNKESDHHGGYFSLGCASDPLGDDTCPGKAAYYTEPVDNMPNAIKAWNLRPLEDALRAERDLAIRERDEAREQAGEYRKDIAMIGARANDLEKETLYMHTIATMARDALKRRVTPPPADDGDR